MTVLAFGCSVAHGAETAHPANDSSNLPFSYPTLVAKHLGVECNNYAFCGNSNENIFHGAIEYIPKIGRISALIVGWTSTERETWQCDGRTWQFIPSWCSSRKNIWKPFAYYKEGKRSADVPQQCADEEQYMKTLSEIYPLLLRYKFDHAEYNKKRNHYRSALTAYCKEKNIRLIETCWYEPMKDAVDLGKIGSWYPWTSTSSRHPNREEHEMFAQEIINHYKL